MSKHRVAVLRVVAAQSSVTDAAAECGISRQHLHRLLHAPGGNPRHAVPKTDALVHRATGARPANDAACGPDGPRAWRPGSRTVRFANGRRDAALRREWVDAIVSVDLARHPDAALYAGYANGRPVSTGPGVRTGRTIGVYNTG